MTSISYYACLDLFKNLWIKGLRWKASNRLPFLLLSTLRSWQKHSQRGARQITLSNPLVFIFRNSPMSPFHRVRVAVIFRISWRVADLVTVIWSNVQRFSTWCSQCMWENCQLAGGLCGWLRILMFVLLHSLIKKPQELIPAHKGSMKGFDEHFSFLLSWHI